jgi:uncharacterized protein YqhQ
MFRKLRQLFRLAVYTQLMPALESADDPLIGGQAVLEGVMMRAPHSYCIAVRKPDGEIATEQGEAIRLSEKNKLWGLPVVRGVATLFQSMSLGMKALNFSAQFIEDEDEEPKKKGEETKSKELPKWMIALNIAFSLGFMIFLYKFLPLTATKLIQGQVGFLDNQVGFSAVEGVIRLSIFVTFMFALSLMKDIRRVFEYHGAEHKVVFNYESDKPVNTENAQSFVTYHPRCGTSFLMVVMIVSVIVYAFVPIQGFWQMLLSRVVLLPVIAGLSYEVIRFAAQHQQSLMRLFVAPGMWLQRITTKPPDDSQVDISIRALSGAMALEEEKGGELVVA